MNKLTKFLVKELLDEPKTVAIYGGGFKPPTKGHFHVVEKALEQYPEIDELKIFVGGGVRDGITQDESLQIWDIYKKHISDIIDVEPSVAPVKSVLGYAKENPNTEVYWILGAREGDEDDLKDIEERTKSLSKYPNIEVKIITTAGGVSGTKTRAAIKSDNKEQFFHLIPDISDEEKEQIWNIVSPVIKENLITDIKSKIKKFILAVKQESKETKKAVSLLIKATKGEIELTDEQKEQIGNQLKDVLKTIGLTALAVLPGGIIVATLLKIFKQEHLVTPSSFMNEVGEANLKPYKWEEVDAEGYYVYTRFITDSETQYDVDIKSTVYFPPGQMDSVPALEIEFSAKPKGAEGSSAKIVVNKGEMYRVMSTIVNIIKKYIKKSRAEAIIYSPSKKSGEDFGTQRDQLYRAFISKAFPGTIFKQSDDFVTAILPNNAALTLEKADPKKGTGKKPEGSGRRLYTDEDPKDTVHIKFKTKEDIVDTLNKTSFKAKSHARQSQVINLIHQRVRAAYGKAKDPEVKARLKRALDYIEGRKEASKEKTKRLNKMKEASDPQSGTALPYGSGFAPIKESYQFKISDKDYDSEDNSLITVIYKFSTPDNTYRVEFYSGEYSPESKIFDVSFGLDKGYNSKLDTFQMTGEGNALSILKTVVNIIIDFTNKFEVNKLVINPTSEKRGKVYSMILKSLPSNILNKIELIQETVTATQVICDNCGWGWDKKDGGKDLYICHKCGHDNTPNSLNEGHYDSISRQIAKLTVNYWKEGFAKGKNEINYIDRITPDEYPTDLEFLYNGGVIFTPAGGKYSHNGYAMPKGETKDGTPRVGVNYFVPKDMIPQGWEEIYMDLIVTLRHEIEHLTQSGSNVKQGKEISSDMKLRKLIDTNKDVVRYVLLPKEVDANVQGLYLKAKKWRRPYAEVVDEWIRDFVKIKKQSDIDLIKGVYNKRAKELNLPPILENDPFGLNEFARQFVKEALKGESDPMTDLNNENIPGWEFKDYLLSLTKFMVDNGWNIQPFPKVQIINDDLKNASKYLGMTGFYNPSTKTVTLYAAGRHPKDIMRTYSHEMVHHMQNLENRLHHGLGTDVNKDTELMKVEDEAYEKGNTIFREWEDQLKEKNV